MEKKIIKTPRLSNEEFQTLFGKITNFDHIVDLLKKSAFAKFDESIELALRLTNKKKKTDKTIRGTLSLSNSVIKVKPKIAVFASGEDLEKARKAGAAFAGLEDLVEEITQGKIQYDYYVATKAVIGQISKAARFLKGLMPNLKLGTVTEDVEATCKRLLEGVVQYREDKSNIVHAKIGYKSFNNDQVKTNVSEFLKYLYNNYNNGRSVAEFFKSVHICTTMGRGIVINNNILISLIKE
jgi:large subunit ribosomal protein L1